MSEKPFCLKPSLYEMRFLIGAYGVVFCSLIVFFLYMTFSSARGFTADSAKVLCFSFIWLGAAVSPMFMLRIKVADGKLIFKHLVPVKSIELSSIIRAELSADRRCRLVIRYRQGETAGEFRFPVRSFAEEEIRALIDKLNDANCP